MAIASAKSQGDKLRELVQRFEDENGSTPLDLKQVAKWAIANGKWRAPVESEEQRLAKLLRRACRDDYTTDSQGRRVRRRHSFPVEIQNPNGSPTQTILWGKMDNMVPKQMHASLTNRRNQIVSDACQLKTDADSYNDNHNTGPPIKLLWDLTDDIADREQSATYTGGEPEEEERV